MNDASAAIEARYREMLMRRSGSERLKMGCSMLATARALVRASVQARDPSVSPAGLRLGAPRRVRHSPRLEAAHDLLGKGPEDRLPLDESLTRVLRQDDDPRDLGHGHHASYLLAHFLGG